MVYYLIAVYLLCNRYHSGQCSKGYRLRNMAERRGFDWYNLCISRVIGEVESRFVDTRQNSYWGIRGTHQRNMIAFWLKGMRHSRKSL